MALDDYGIDIEALQQMYEEWAQDGVPKSVVEKRYLGTTRSHGKLFSRLVRQYLGIETERTHGLVDRLADLERYAEALERQIEELGATPVERTRGAMRETEAPQPRLWDDPDKETK